MFMIAVSRGNLFALAVNSADCHATMCFFIQFIFKEVARNNPQDGFGGK